MKGSRYVPHRACLAVLLCLCAGVPGRAEAEPVRIDMNHSTVGFAVPILGGLSEVTGKFAEFEVEFDLDADDFTQSTISATLQVSGISTGVRQRDAHLKARDFFDMRNHPEISFRSTNIERAGDDYLLEGNLSIRGNERAIELPLKVVGRHTNPETGKMNIGFEATATINRDDFGVSYRHDYAPFIGSDVEIRLRIITRTIDFDPGDL